MARDTAGLPTAAVRVGQPPLTRLVEPTTLHSFSLESSWRRVIAAHLPRKRRLEVVQPLLPSAGTQRLPSFCSYLGLECDHLGPAEAKSRQPLRQVFLSRVGSSD